jgi:hypothetical protein
MAAILYTYSEQSYLNSSKLNPFPLIQRESKYPTENNNLKDIWTQTITKPTYGKRNNPH